MPMRPCLGIPGRSCGRLTARSDSRCDDCASEWHRARDARRGNRHQRGYTAEHAANRDIVLAQSRICWLCGHDGADQADDVIPKSLGGTSAVANLKPAHGTKPCPTCGRRCNQARGNRDPHAE